MGNWSNKKLWRNQNNLGLSQDNLGFTGGKPAINGVYFIAKGDFAGDRQIKHGGINQESWEYIGIFISNVFFAQQPGTLEIIQRGKSYYGEINCLNHEIFQAFPNIFPTRLVKCCGICVLSTIKNMDWHHMIKLSIMAWGGVGLLRASPLGDIVWDGEVTDGLNNLAGSWPIWDGCDLPLSLFFVKSRRMNFSR